MNTDNEDDIGIVFRKTLGRYNVHTNGREIDCVLSSLLHKHLIYPTADPTSLRHKVQEVRELDKVDPVAIGERVRYVNAGNRSEEHTSELQSQSNLVCRLLLEKK